ncbi:Hypothetical protein RMP42_05183 (plasmid) [Roseomonas mucosa]|nr:Hypothetical protein RMP42_05183 [Roseomonas mucosa]
MALATALLLTTHLLTPQALSVDFRLSPSGPPQGPAVSTGRPVDGSPADVTENRTNSAPSVRRTARPSVFFTAARGFGTDVPLSFAARQIVPAAFSVRYADNIDPNAPVSWVGEKPWNRALQDAIRPLGLRMTLVQGTVTISR